MTNICSKTMNGASRQLNINSFQLGLLFVIILASYIMADAEADLQLNKNGQRRQLCNDWASNQTVKNLIETGSQNADHCPCAEEVLKLDYSFERLGRCYKQFFFRKGAKQMCCYDDHGKLSTGSKNSGYLIIETLETEIENSYSNCCYGDDTDMCDVFYDVNLSDDCSQYKPPIIETSWGDPHITTIDNIQYDFNGHGEYIYLQNDEFAIQARTDYTVAGNKDGTIFTAFAFQDKTKKSDTINIILDRKANDVLVYSNTKNICNASQSTPRPCPWPPVRLPIGLSVGTAEDGTRLVIVNLKPIGGYVKKLQITVKAGSLSITHNPLANQSHVDLLGIAGGLKDNSLQFRNGSFLRLNSTVNLKFDFAETWRLQNKTESIFDYGISNRSFDYYNHNKTRPTFLQELLGNLTALFNTEGHSHNDSEIILFNNTCKGYKQCLLAIARSDDIEQGKAEVKVIEDKLYYQRLSHNKPPEFNSNMTIPHVVNVTMGINASFVLNLTKYTYDVNEDDTLTYAVDTVIPDSDYRLEGGLFTWNLTHNLVKVLNSSVVGILLTFRVADDFNETIVYQPIVYFCGCLSSHECNFPKEDSSSEAKLQIANCKCDEFYEGRFCDKQQDPCKIIHCYEKDKCNSSNLEHPCAECPPGYEGDGQLCDDSNECLDSSNNNCTQNCTNESPFFSCSCYDGYNMDTDNITCNDIDECTLATRPGGNCDAEKKERCVNFPGGSQCDCISNYYRKEDTCISAKGGYAYTSALHITVTKMVDVDAVNETSIQIQLTKLLQNTTGFTYLEIISITYRTLARNKRQAATEGRYLDVKYKIYSTKQMNYSEFMASQQQSMTGKSSFIDVSDEIKTAPLGHIQNEESAICNATDTHHTPCDHKTTTCRGYLGDITCDCRSGYKKEHPDDYFCKDINECDLWTNMSSLCVYGQCANQPSTYACECTSDPDYTTVKSLGNGKYRCEGNFQYIGEVTMAYISTGDIINVNNSFLQTINNLYLNSSVLVNGSLTMHEILVSINIMNTTRTNQDELIYKYRIMYIVHIGIPLNVTELSKFQTNVFNGYGGVTFTFKDAKILNEKEFSICDIDGKTTCDLTSTYCVVTNGAYSCKCNPGYTTLTGITDRCDDINECDFKDKYHCDGGNCNNSPLGNWTCACASGYESVWYNQTNVACIDIDECINANIKNGTCNNTNGSWFTECVNGFKHANTMDNKSLCIDINECEGIIGGANGTCINTDGDYYLLCKEGYEHVIKEDNKSVCNDTNECKRPNSCLENIDCVNKVGSWLCVCRDGVAPTPVNTTTYICGGDYQYVITLKFLLLNEIHVNETTALSNFLQDKLEQLYEPIFSSIRIEYVSINLASTSIKRSSRDDSITFILHFDVHQHASKIDQVWTNYTHEHCKPTIVCPQLSDTNNAFALYFKEIDLDNSSDSLCKIPRKNVCDKESTTCAVIDGKIACKCKNGFENSTSTPYRCKDVDECQINSYTCGGRGNCTNIPGNWTCMCDQGFKIDDSDRSQCINIDECTDMGYCKSNGTCLDTEGSWTCSCDTGYTENSYTNQCTDVDECSDGKSCLGTGYQCTNTKGSYNCSCEQGYSRAENSRIVTCTDKCDSSPCGNAATCYHFNNVDGYQCSCPVGKMGKHCDETPTTAATTTDVNQTPETTSSSENHLKTILIAAGSSAAALIILLVISIILIYRWKTKKTNDTTDKMSLHNLGNGLYGINGSVHNGGHDNTSFNDWTSLDPRQSQRDLRHITDTTSLPGHRLNGDANGHAHAHGYYSMENLLHPPRSPKPDYVGQGSPKIVYAVPGEPRPDYQDRNDRPIKAPKPDYPRNGAGPKVEHNWRRGSEHVGRVSDESHDSGMENGFGSLNGDNRRPRRSRDETLDVTDRRPESYPYAQPHKLKRYSLQERL